jgi:hypothetical protein
MNSIEEKKKYKGGKKMLNRVSRKRKMLSSM